MLEKTSDIIWDVLLCACLLWSTSHHIESVSGLREGATWICLIILDKFVLYTIHIANVLRSVESTIKLITKEQVYMCAQTERVMQYVISVLRTWKCVFARVTCHFAFRSGICGENHIIDLLLSSWGINRTKLFDELATRVLSPSNTVTFRHFASKTWPQQHFGLTVFTHQFSVLSVPPSWCTA